MKEGTGTWTPERQQIMEEQDSDISNEAAALADILRWSQRDALRRLCGQIKLDAAEITALVAICKGTDKAAPLDASHIRDPAASHAVVRLKAKHVRQRPRSEEHSIRLRKIRGRNFATDLGET